MREGTQHPFSQEEKEYLINYVQYGIIRKAYEATFNKASTYAYQYHKKVIAKPDANLFLMELETTKRAYISPDHDMNIDEIAGVLSSIARDKEVRSGDRIKALERFMLVTQKDKQYQEIALDKFKAKTAGQAKLNETSGNTSDSELGKFLQELKEDSIQTTSEEV